MASLYLNCWPDLWKYTPFQESTCSPKCRPSVLNSILKKKAISPNNAFRSLRLKNANRSVRAKFDKIGKYDTKKCGESFGQWSWDNTLLSAKNCLYLHCITLYIWWLVSPFFIFLEDKSDSIDRRKFLLSFSFSWSSFSFLSSEAMSACWASLRSVNHLATTHCYKSFQPILKRIDQSIMYYKLKINQSIILPPYIYCHQSIQPILYHKLKINH